MNRYRISRYDSARARFVKSYAQFLDKRLDEFLAGKAKPENKAAVKRIVEDSALEILKIEIEPLNEMFEEIERYGQDLQEYRELKSEMDGLGDERSKVALSLYRMISKGEPTDDNYAKCRRITAAGLVAASYLGLQGYEVSNQKEEFNKK